jgi:hypothetical protein
MKCSNCGSDKLVKAQVQPTKAGVTRAFCVDCGHEWDSRAKGASQLEDTNNIPISNETPEPVTTPAPEQSLGANPKFVPAPVTFMATVIPFTCPAEVIIAKAVRMAEQTKGRTALNPINPEIAAQLREAAIGMGAREIPEAGEASGAWWGVFDSGAQITIM